MSHVIIESLLYNTKRNIKSDRYPLVLFHNVIQNILAVKIIREMDDKNEYVVTLYTQKFYINLDRTTHINYRTKQEHEHIEVFPDTTVLNLYNTVDFYRGTVRLKRINDDLNKKMYYASTSTLIKELSTA